MKINKNLTITIGIPAYNEEGNIGRLLKELLKQKKEGFKLDKIVVVSDASRDRTDEIVKGIKDKRVELLRNRQRSGQAKSQNRIIKACMSDVLVLMNADVLPAGGGFLTRLVEPMRRNDQVGLVGAKVVPMPARNWFESVINFSHVVKIEMAEKIRKGDTIHLCHGRARAFKKDFYRQLRFLPVVGEDAFSYLSCKSKGWKFVYQPKAVVWYRSPDNLAGHSRQSVRAMLSQKKMAELFPDLDVEQEYRVPTKLMVESGAKALLVDPIRTIAYGLILIKCRVESQWTTEFYNPLWNSSVSSKVLSHK